jgi:glycosyltransferase involved in cell wall biosynthesis
MPDVSVVMPVYNESLHIEEALTTVAHQSGLSFEIILIDDGSTDDTLAIAQGLAARFPVIKVFRNPKKSKVSAVNYGVEMAQGKYVCLFAGDDIMPAESLAIRLSAVLANTGTRPVVGLCRLITLSEDPAKNGKVVPRDPKQGAYSGACYMFDRRALALAFPIPEELPNEDTWLELGVLHFDFELVHNGVIGCAWRIHAGNSINLLVDWPEFNGKLTPRMAAARLFLDRHGNEVSETARRALQERVACEDARKRGDIFGILRTKVSLVAKLRAISLSGASLYAVRQRAYSLFSGW